MTSPVVAGPDKALNSAAMQCRDLKDSFTRIPWPSDPESQLLFSIIREGIELVEGALFALPRNEGPALAHLNRAKYVEGLERAINVLIDHTNKLKS